MKPSLKKAFTFIEMLGVLCIVVILISISTIAFRHGQQKARDMVRKTDLQMIADALISYGNDHGHFPSSIYDNVGSNIGKTPGEVYSIIEALNNHDDGCNYAVSNNDDRDVTATPSEDSINLDEISPEYKTENFDAGGVSNLGNEGGKTTVIDWDRLRRDAEHGLGNIGDKRAADGANVCENNTPGFSDTDTGINNFGFAIVTQGMCVSNLAPYLVNNGYISQIPQDPSLGSVKLETNICINEINKDKGDTPIDITRGVNANGGGRSIPDPSDCLAITNSGCTQICKSGYIYVSDGHHFALIARMESENNGNYETTACGSCELAGACANTSGKQSWTSTDQLPCDITDEFTNTFDCIKNTGIVEYATGQYYFYIY